MIATIVLLLHLLGYIPAENAVNFLYLTGALLILAEIFVTSFGIIAFNGVLALYIAYVLQTGQNALFGIPVDWPFLFGIAFIEVLLIVTTVLVFLYYRKKQVTTGTESMVGSIAEVLAWEGSEGFVRIQGEKWKAISENSLELKKHDKVKVCDIDKLILHIEQV